MKSNLLTAIVTAVVGALIAYFGCNYFIGDIESVTVKTVEGISTELPEPNPDVFNYRALNPTVEVFVGNCSEYDGDGQCLDEEAADEIINLETNPEESSNSNNQGGQGN